MNDIGLIHATTISMFNIIIYHHHHHRQYTALPVRTNAGPSALEDTIYDGAAVEVSVDCALSSFHISSSQNFLMSFSEKPICA